MPRSPTRRHLHEVALTSVLIVGAGFAGAVYARTLAESGMHVDVIDRRAHIGGNAFDDIVAGGVRVHRYGPHLLHTNAKRVVDWLSRFGSFVPYEHRVEAFVPQDRYVPLPINRRTINTIFDVSLRTSEEVQAFLTAQSIPAVEARNAAEYLHSRIGVRLTDLLFRPYTKKMWSVELEDMDAAVVKRIPLRFDDEDRYFPSDRYQLLPERGYAALFANILGHERIRVTLNTPFHASLLQGYGHCFNSMAIDEYFDEEFGPLPYRSIRFHHRPEPLDYSRGSASVINFTDDGPFTRETDWSRLPNQDAGRGVENGAAIVYKTLTQEEPCDYRDNAMERYYPVKTSDGRNDAIYQRYRERASREARVSFIGRCGTYQYLDMDQVIGQSLMRATAWLETSR
jgi:UDP-galactopyranose mutase